MTNIGKKEEWMIQSKIDGNPTGRDEEQFNELMRNSAEARIAYQRLLSLDHAIKRDSENIPAADFSTRIMRRLKEGQNTVAGVPGKTIRFIPDKSRKMLVYAAILLTGLLSGSLITYISTREDQHPNATVVSGTMAERIVPGEYYSQNGTQIKITQAEADSFRLFTITLTSAGPVDLTIDGSDEKLRKDQLVVLFSDGIFQVKEADNGSLLGRCSGKHIFQISCKKPARSPHIRFSRNNRIFYELNPE